MSGRRAAGLRAEHHERSAPARRPAPPLRSPAPAMAVDVFSPAALAALQSAAGNAAVGRAMAAPPAGSPATGPAVVQRSLTVGGRKVVKALFQPDDPVAETWQEVTSLPRFRSRSPADQQLMEAQFRKWVDDTRRGHQQRPDSHTFGRKMQEREYDDVDELERGLYGWVAAKPGRRQEKEYARQVRASAEVDVRLNRVLVGIYAAVMRFPPDRRDPVIGELRRNDVPAGRSSKPLGTYQRHLQEASRKRSRPELATHVTNGFLDVLRDPTRYDFRDKVVTLHDLMEYFGPQQPWLPPSAGRDLLGEPEAQEVLSTVGYSDGRRQTSESRGRKDHQGTRDENDPVTRFAREQRLPLWSGSSYTMARILRLGKWADNVTERDLTALAHSLFAFWRIDYDHSSHLAAHTLHETMDIASNFGVPYNPAEPGGEFRHGDVEARQQELKADIDTLLDRAALRIEHIRSQLLLAEMEMPAHEVERRKSVLRDADRRIDDFARTYPTLQGDQRTAAMNSVLLVLPLLTDLDPGT